MAKPATDLLTLLSPLTPGSRNPGPVDVLTHGGQLQAGWGSSASCTEGVEAFEANRPNRQERRKVPGIEVIS